MRHRGGTPPAAVEAAEAAGTGRLCLSSQGYTPYAPVGRGKLGGLLYIDLSDDASLEDKVKNELAEEVRTVTEGECGTVDQSGGAPGGGGHPRA